MHYEFHPRRPVDASSEEFLSPTLARSLLLVSARVTSWDGRAERLVTACERTGSQSGRDVTLTERKFELRVETRSSPRKKLFKNEVVRALSLLVSSGPVILSVARPVIHDMLHLMNGSFLNHSVVS